jgi:hypothetical protein
MKAISGEFERRTQRIKGNGSLAELKKESRKTSENQ